MTLIDYKIMEVFEITNKRKKKKEKRRRNKTHKR